MMKFFFWQNTNSIHQSAFLNSLAELEIGAVTLIVTEPLSQNRKDMGWVEPVLKNVTVFHLDDNDYKDILNTNVGKDSIHIFSGIAAFTKVHLAFVYASAIKCRIGIFTEPLDFRGPKGFLRIARGFYHKIVFSHRIEFVLATGELGVKQFQLWGYDKKRIFEWAYTVENSSSTISKSNEKEEERSFKIIFAGSLIPRKGYDILIKSLKKLTSPFTADFYCLKEDQIDLGKKIEIESGLGNRIKLLPFLPNSDLRSQMNEYDLFVLPSRHDGWGAVICESLMEGTPVLVSRFCGSSSLVTNEKIGKVIANLDEESIAIDINYFLAKGRLSSKERIENRNWALKNISGASMAQYFKNVIYFTNTNNVGSTPLAPWRS